ncbi:MAG: GntR family transcriptional regulator [Acetobacteraceae bacterium]
MAVEAKHAGAGSGSLQPLWVHVANTLRNRLERGGGGASSLSDVALANEFKVSTMVVRRAVGQLVEEGLLVRRRGKGTFVANQPLHGSLDAPECLVDEWRLQGHNVRIELIDRRRIAANIAVAAGLGVQPGEAVTYLRRLRYVDDLPVAMDYRHMPDEVVDGIPDEAFLHQSIGQVLRRHKNIDPSEMRTTIKATSATPEVAGYLGVEIGSPILDHEVQVIDQHGRVLILGSSHYHPDRFVYSTRITERRLK